MQDNRPWFAIIGFVGLFTFVVAGGSATAGGPFSSDKVALYAHIDLIAFGANSGNDCWGYVSPSGREYALMGVRNKVAFVEITNPATPDWFASIPHSDSLWCDIKVYQDVAYAVTEDSGTGIQVIDMSNIDNHIVTLAQTIASPGTSHNVALDPDSARLYTCGSNQGAGTTVIFDISNPLFPVELGTGTGTYFHDEQVVTYSGPDAEHTGKQIMFGAAAGFGVDIVDVSNPNNPVLLSRTPYPDVDFCHQLWTEDMVHLYIDDEGDSIARTTVMDISDLDNPIVLGDFSSGLDATDHNLYVRDGFLFEANYRSGLRIFDTNIDPVNPPEVGWFDTFPGGDQAGFEGAWSVYPFFPSGTVIVSDIDRGLFILDVSEAVGAGEAIPTVSEWGMIGMAVLLIAGGAFMFRRRVAT